MFMHNLEFNKLPPNMSSIFTKITVVPTHITRNNDGYFYSENQNEYQNIYC